MRILPTAAAVSLLLTAGAAIATAPAQAAAQAVNEAVVNCVDLNTSQHVDGDNLFLLTDLDPDITERTPAGTVEAECTNSHLSDNTATGTVTFDDGSTLTLTLRPGETLDINSAARAVQLKPIELLEWKVA